MKPAFVLVFLVYLAPTINFAQATQFGSDPVPIACPILLHAQHLSDGDLVKTDGAHPKGIGQALRLTVASSTHGVVTQADILLHGWTPKGRYSQAAPDSSATVTRRQHIQFAAGSDQSLADIWVAGLSAITSIEIASAIYSDGSAWSPSANLSCSIKPDLFMPVKH